MSWLDDIVTQHAELESPQSFWKWSALAALSAVLKDNVWLDRQIFRTYPNIYVMLHADSGLKKGPPVNMAKRLVKQVNNTRIITGRASIQGILKELATAESRPGGKIEMKSVAFICSSELSSSIVEDKVATKILTDLYDRSYNEGEWKSLLKMESFHLKDPTVSMLTATNEAMSEDFFTKSAIQGGYFARTFIIYERTNPIVNSLIYPLEHAPDYKAAADYLKEIAKLKGPFRDLAKITGDEEYRFPKIKKTPLGERTIYFNQVGLVYDDWYDTFKEMVSSQEIKDDTGTLNRFGDSVLKVAMLLSLAQHPKLEITEPAMRIAISECEKIVGNARRTTLGKQGMSQSAILKSLIIMELLGRDDHRITRTLLMKKLWMHYSNHEEFDNLMQSFHAAGMILTGNVGNNIIYTMPDEQVTELKKLMAGKGK